MEAPTFDSIPLSADVRRAVDAMGYLHPTPVQRAVFEPASRGKDLLVQARTGTGKTAAFGLPLVEIARKSGGVQALVLCPTRELALQVTREVEKLAQFRGVNATAIYGGAPMGKQIEALESGSQIVVGTPGRVLDHLRRKTLNPSGIRALVLDEADEMLSMGFARELHAIMELLPKERQNLLFSATMPPDIERLARSHLRDPEFLLLSSDQVGALEITHIVYLLRAGDKKNEFARILEVEDPESAIVFCNTKDETERLAEFLQARGYDADWLNGDLDQKEREAVMSRTREGRLRFLVATDVAARGIDISHLTHVINFDFPENTETYVHRTGRTGRAGKTGTAISLIGPKDIGNLYLLRLTYKVRPIERHLPSAGELKTRAEADVVQLFVDAFADKPVDAEDLAVTRRLLSHEAGERIVAQLIRDHLGARPGDPKQEAAEARRAKNPAPAPAPAPAMREPEPTPTASREPRPAGENGRSAERRGGEHRSVEGRPEGRGPKRRGVRQATLAQWEPPRESDDDSPILGMPSFTVSDAPAVSESAATTSSDGVRVFVNVGRRDGVRSGDLERLCQGAGIQVDRIIVRDRASFLKVPRAALERVTQALSGQSLGGRTIVAELAREQGE